MATADTRKQMLAHNLEVTWASLIKQLAGIRYRGQPPNQAGCNQLPLTPAEERVAFIEANWGRPALEKYQGTLDRINALETELATLQ